MVRARSAIALGLSFAGVAWRAPAHALWFVPGAHSPEAGLALEVGF